MKDFQSRLNQLENSTKMAGICGGTVSSAQLKEALELKSLNKDPHSVDLLDSIIETWRTQLKRHNAQTIKVFEYDPNTGDVVP